MEGCKTDRNHPLKEDDSDRWAYGDGAVSYLSPPGCRYASRPDFTGTDRNRRFFTAGPSLRPKPLRRSKISRCRARCCRYRSARASPFHVAVRPDPALPARVPIMRRCDGGSRDQAAGGLR